jgi:hypothetical protein
MYATGMFSELATQKVGRMNRQLKHKMTRATVDKIVEQCCRRWHDEILPEFSNDGRSWLVEYDMPTEFTAFKHGLLDFGNGEIMSCFTPSISLIKKMVVRSVRKMRNSQGILPSVSAREVWSRSPPPPLPFSFFLIPGSTQQVLT